MKKKNLFCSLTGLCRLLVSLVMALPVLALPAAMQAAGDEAVSGDWRGPSTCQVRPSACNDEDSLYHFTRMEKKSGWYSLLADKIVDGKPVTMGPPLDCSYAAAQHSLECKFPKGVLEFVVQGKTMQGTMKLTDGTLWRKLSLKKVE
jgi:hypothetical protein